VRSLVDTLRIRTLKKQIAGARKRCDALALQFQSAQTEAERSRIAGAYDKALQKTHARQFVLELLERKAREAAGTDQVEPDRPKEKKKSRT
jgi:hypothetical protein